MIEALLIQAAHKGNFVVEPFVLKNPATFSYPIDNKFSRNYIELIDNKTETEVQANSLFVNSGDGVDFASYGQWGFVIWGNQKLTDDEKQKMYDVFSAHKTEDKEPETDADYILRFLFSTIHEEKPATVADVKASTVKEAIKKLFRKEAFPRKLIQSTFIINNGDTTAAYSGNNEAFFSILELDPKLKIVKPYSNLRISSNTGGLRGVVVSSLDHVAGKKCNKIDKKRCLTIEKNFEITIEQVCFSSF